MHTDATATSTGTAGSGWRTYRPSSNLMSAPGTPPFMMTSAKGGWTLVSNEISISHSYGNLLLLGSGICFQPSMQNLNSNDTIAGSIENWPTRSRLCLAPSAPYPRLAPFARLPYPRIVRGCFGKFSKYSPGLSLQPGLWAAPTVL